MINKIKDKQNKFLLITVPTTESYKVLFLFIPEINQIQFIARQGKWKGSSYCKDQWEAIDWGYRTTVEKISDIWALEVTIEELNLEQVEQFCPDICDIEYSTKMLEDIKIRKRYGQHT